MRRASRIFVVAATIAFVAGLTSQAQAALITVYDPSGQSDFSVTYDDQQTGPFGQPQIANNTVYFLPNDFFATSANGIAPDSMNDSFVFRLDVLAGQNFSLDQFDLTERGDYRLDGAGATVSADGTLSAYDNFNQSTVFSDVLDTGPLNIADGQLHNWTGNASIGGTDGWSSTSSAWITIDSTLSADTGLLNDFAFIEKKFTGVAIQLEVSQVPVPPAFWMFGAALLTLLRRGHRA